MSLGKSPRARFKKAQRLIEYQKGIGFSRQMQGSAAPLIERQCQLWVDSVEKVPSGLGTICLRTAGALGVL